jgi:pimeloyl-ACP methyl ester carboxylesterase
MATAHLHDGATLEVEVRGEGPALLLPVSTAIPDEAIAEQLRAWGGDPALGHGLATGLAEAGYRVITADYEGHLGDHPKPSTLTADALAADLLAIADAAGADRFGYYGYSWLALAGLQLAIRTDRLTALAMGGYPPLGGPYAAMLTVTRATYAEALANADAPRPSVEVEPGDWDSAPTTQSPPLVQQYVTLYESLDGFDERASLAGLAVPRLAFAGMDDEIVYGPRWDNAVVSIGPALAANRDELTGLGWTVELVPGDHLAAMHAARVLPVLTGWLAGLD